MSHGSARWYRQTVARTPSSERRMMRTWEVKVHSWAAVRLRARNRGVVRFLDQHCGRDAQRGSACDQFMKRGAVAQRQRAAADRVRYWGQSTTGRKESKDGDVWVPHWQWRVWTSEVEICRRQG
ncbi:hypothetical protein NDU88_003104 [Pleurodeles waltl]|uniref:Uncharacterized protein n=1 Tax=Pleurodeles waltl TaxID=8319 RepID=A0AAV7PH89_PLEWA|nr:hypothetical protein NDU88_003104 [Pleurodeles waltl]